VVFSIKSVTAQVKVKNRLHRDGRDSSTIHTAKTSGFFVIILYKWLAMAKKLPSKGKSKGKGSNYDRWIVVRIVLTLAAIALSLWGPLRRFGSVRRKPAQQVKARAGTCKQITPEKPEKKEKPEKRTLRKRNSAKVPIIKPSEKTALVAIELTISVRT
jgi:hypothetical protein